MKSICVPIDDDVDEADEAPEEADVPPPVDENDDDEANCDELDDAVDDDELRCVAATADDSSMITTRWKLRRSCIALKLLIHLSGITEVNMSRV